ncbi:MAG: cupin domain-containing protein [Candidatus Heteroscillospira sp.]
MHVPEKDVLFMDKGNGVTQRALGHHDNLMAVEMTFQKGAVFPPHKHSDHVQGIYIVKGKFEIICGGESTVVGPGDMFYADYNEPHGTTCLEDNSVLLDIHTPMRRDIWQESVEYNEQHK